MDRKDTDSMSTANSETQTPGIPEDLVRRLVEIIEWHKSGVAELSALQAYVDANLSHLTDIDALRIAEEKTLMEAARLVVALAGKSHG